MNIIHIAWLGHNNYGDDVMAEALRNRPANKDKNIKYTVWCDERPRESSNVKWIYPFDIKNKFYRRFCERRALKNADVLIIGGGSVLHSAKSIGWKREAVEYLKTKNLRARAVGFNLSVGPFDNEETANECCGFLKSLDACSLRDKESFEFAEKCGLPYNPVLAFDLAACFLKNENISPRAKPSKIESVGLTIREAHRTDPESVFERYIDLLKKLSVSYRTVKLFCFSRDNQESELSFCKKLKEAAGSNNIEIVTYDLNMKKFTGELKSVDFLISTKLHGAIIAFLLNVPFATISYQKKLDDLAKYVGLPAKYQFKQSNFRADDILNAIGPEQITDTKPFYDLAEKNFEVLNF